MKKILITGVTGQDGIFLVNKLTNLDQEFEIIGISREKNESLFYNKLKLISSKPPDNLNLIDLNLLNSNDVNNFISSYKPDQVYNLSGPSSVYESIENDSIHNEIIKIFSNLTESLISNNNLCRFYQASSSEMFKDNNGKKLTETSIALPASPYAKAKFYNHKKVTELNKKYEWNIYSGIMFNHESEFRNNNYLFMKIINAAIRISQGKEDELILGSLEYIRDWSFAGDVAEAMYKINNHGNDESYIIGSGVGNSILSVVEIVFNFFKLNWEDFVIIDKNHLRPGDPKIIISDPSKIKNELNWENTLSFESLVNRCIESKL